MIKLTYNKLFRKLAGIDDGDEVPSSEMFRECRSISEEYYAHAWLNAQSLYEKI